MKYRSCKDCPQYDKCVTTSNLAIKRKRCEFADNSRNKKRFTHYDRIKAMSVEEMVEFLGEIAYRCVWDECEYCPLKAGCHKSDIKIYLESEVQGDA